VNGVHDMGGMHGFGPVEREDNEPVFHAEWEKRVVGINRSAQARRIYNIDEFRHGIERMAPAEYLEASYYERWLATVERNLVEKGLISPEELEAKVAELRDRPDAEPPRREDPALAERIATRLRRRPQFRRDGAAEPRFKVGEPVVTRNTHPTGHTRLPRYARGKRGVIAHLHGVYVFPDTNAHGQGEQPQPLYSVRFDARELWADSAEPGACVHLDLWESYLAGVGEEGP
jgi:nitrile hydratase subunit beta